MKRYFFIGDTHNDLAFAARAIERARKYGAEVVQLGDFGFLWPGNDRLQELSDLLTRFDVTMRAIDGNHDDHPRLRAYVKACTATPIAPNVIYQPRGSVHEDEDGTRFLFCGGAPSIDRAFRIAGKSWWPEEVIMREEFECALSATGPIHVLVTHDAPGFPPGFSPKGTPDYQRAQEESMRMVDALITRHRPMLHIHGHWHWNYQRQHDNGTRIVGLDCNNARFEDAVLLWSRPSASVDGMS